MQNSRATVVQDPGDWGSLDNCRICFAERASKGVRIAPEHGLDDPLGQA
jgi:hypothetical protein